MMLCEPLDPVHCGPQNSFHSHNLVWNAAGLEHLVDLELRQRTKVCGFFIGWHSLELIAV